MTFGEPDAVAGGCGDMAVLLGATFVCRAGAIGKGAFPPHSPVRPLQPLPPPYGVGSMSMGTLGLVGVGAHPGLSHPHVLLGETRTVSHDV